MTDAIHATQTAVLTSKSPNDRGSPVYTPEQIALYEAVLHHEDERVAALNGGEIKVATMMAGGLTGKSALLDRIAAGQKPLVMAPPLSFSYPAYEMIEDEGPIETLINEDLSLDDMLKLGAQAASYRKTKAPCVVINQWIWDLLRVTGKESALVTCGGWASLGFTWRLSKDAYPLSGTQSRIIAWHNPELGHIRTLDELKAEQRWHVMKMIERLKTAADDGLTQKALEEARQKDASAGSRINGEAGPVSGLGLISSVYEYTVTMSRIEHAKKELARRAAEGLPEFPDAAEIQTMVDDKVDFYVGKNRQGGKAGYAVGNDGELLRKCWRLQRVAPAKLPDSIYLDPEALLAQHQARLSQQNQAPVEGGAHGNV